MSKRASGTLWGGTRSVLEHFFHAAPDRDALPLGGVPLGYSDRKLELGVWVVPVSRAHSAHFFYEAYGTRRPVVWWTLGHQQH